MSKAKPIEQKKGRPILNNPSRITECKAAQSKERAALILCQVNQT
jgi:hypothetical protein